MAQDDYFYEIQLSNKQLVFYFMALATGLILSFLAGVMVCRGVDSHGDEVQASRVPQEERVIAEATPKVAPPATEDLTYAQRLEAEKVEEGLEKPAPSPGAVTSPPQPAAAPRAAARSSSARPLESAVPRSPSPAPKAATRPEGAPTAPAPAAAFTIQVGAFKDSASAEAVMARLKSKGFAAYVVAPGAADGLFNVRVGSYSERAEAERVQARLRDEEKFKPFIVRK